MAVEFWQWWLLIMVTTNTVVNLIVFFVGRKFRKPKK
jgi:hypothetical protein|tara:strand:+ start:127 stop:237 length:111 start_codon:yes stop_codon:yes gene_type:complete